MDNGVPPDERGQSKDSLLWSSFEGKLNTELVLREKAEVVARLIKIVWDCAWRLAVGLKDEIAGLRCGEIEARKVRLETAILLIYVVCEKASSALQDDALVDVFAGALMDCVAANLGAEGATVDTFSEVLAQRLQEYKSYPKWLPGKDEGAKGTLFWEFGKKASAVLGVGKHVLFTDTLTNLLLEALSSWQLLVLFQGADPFRQKYTDAPSMHQDFLVEDGVIAYGRRGRELVSAFYELIKGTLPALAATFDEREADEGSYLARGKDSALVLLR